MSSTQKLNGNPEHGGIAFVILITMIVAVIFSYMVLIRILPPLFDRGVGDFVVITAVLSLFLGIGIVALLDPLIKQVWPSGFAVTLDGSEIALRRPREEKVAIDLNAEHRVTRWYYQMSGYPRFGRERQIRKGYYLAGCQIQQDEERIVVHSYVSPLKINRLIEGREFAEIQMDEIYDTSVSGRIRSLRPLQTPGSRPEIPASLIVSDEGQYWLAERHRWAEGVELTNKDFGELIRYLEKR